MASWLNGNLAEWQVSRVVSLWIARIATCLTSELASWQNDGLAGRQVVKMLSW